MKRSILFCIYLVLLSVTAVAEDINTVLYSARKGVSSAMNQLGIMYYTGDGVERDFAKAYYWWREGALKQNPKAIANLGVSYQFGRGVMRDSVAAQKLYITAIANGQTELLRQRSANVATNAFDAMLTGMCQLRGVGTQRDVLSAAESFASAAALGSADGMREAGRAYLLLAEEGETQYLDNALDYLKRGADRGDARSAALAGKILLGYYGGTPNKTQAAGYLRRAAAAGDAEAKSLLAQLTLAGNPAKNIKKEAMTLLKESAEAGCAEGMWAYANALIPYDFDEALFWFAMASEAGYEEEFRSFANSLDSANPLFNYMSGVRAHNAGDDAEAIEHFKKAEMSGHKEAAAIRAYLQVINNTNVKKAVKELQNLAPSNPQAAMALADLNMTGTGVKKNLVKAISLLRTAANEGYAPAFDALADKYFTGYGVDANKKEAVALYDRAFAERRLSDTGRQRLLDHYSTEEPDADIVNRLTVYAPTADLVKNMLEYPTK